MKRIIKNSITIYIGFVIGIFVSILMINADNNLNASNINIDKTNMPNISGTTLQIVPHIGQKRHTELLRLALVYGMSAGTVACTTTMPLVRSLAFAQ